MLSRERLRRARSIPPRTLLRLLYVRSRRRIIHKLRLQRTPAQPYYATQRPFAEADRTRVDADGQVWASPVSLLTPFRFDIAAKCLYADRRERGVDSTFHRELYTTLNDVWSGQFEYQPRKNGAVEFMDAFHEICASVKSAGFDPARSVVNVAPNGTPVDGAHRVAAAIVYDRFVPIRVSESPEYPGYTSDYFLDRGEYVPGGLPRLFADAIALEYARIKRTTHLAFLFPAAGERDEEIRRILNAYGTVVYEKPVYLTERGKFNLIASIYHAEGWLGNADDDYAGVRRKSGNCFPVREAADPDRSRVLAILYEADDLGQVRKAKEAVRTLVGAGEHSVHTTDRHDDTLRLAGMVFNDNSVGLLNASAGVIDERLANRVDAVRAWLTDAGVNLDDVCLDSGAVLNAYGLRPTGDIDVLHRGDIDWSSAPSYVSSHNDEHMLGYYSVGIDEVLYDPRLHFYHRGLKFCSLAVVRAMKVARNEPKDQVDVTLIDGLTSQPSPPA